MSSDRARIGGYCDDTRLEYGCRRAEQRAARVIHHRSEAVAGLLCAMPQRAPRLAVFAGTVGRNYDAYAHAVDHAGQGYQGNHRIFKANALISRAEGVTSMEHIVLNRKAPRYLVVSALIGLGAVTVAAVTVGVRLRSAAASTTPVVVKMIDMPATYQPALLTIKVGQTVEWRNVGNSVHHASS